MRFPKQNSCYAENEDPEISRCEAEGSTANLADDSELQDGDRTLGDVDSSSADCCENQHQPGEEVIDIYFHSAMHLCLVIE